MKEAGYGTQLSHKIEKQLGGKVTKLSDRAGLGRPDYQWLKNGISTFIETKIGKCYELGTTGISEWICYPWKEINDIRQFEVCKTFSKHALVLYAIYYPKIKWSLVLDIEELSEYRIALGGQPKPCFKLKPGHGIEAIKSYSQEDRRYRLDELVIERGKLTQGIS